LSIFEIFFRKEKSGQSLAALKQKKGNYFILFILYKAHKQSPNTKTTLKLTKAALKSSIFPPR